MPAQMHAIDELMELHNEMVQKPTYLGKDPVDDTEEWNTRLAGFMEVFPKYLQKLTDIHNYPTLKNTGPYLVCPTITAGDVMIYSLFWKLLENPNGHDETTQKVRDLVMSYDTIKTWYTQMCQDMKDVMPKATQAVVALGPKKRM